MSKSFSGLENNY